MSGFPAWATWLVVHLFYLVGFQNRLIVLMRWFISFITRGRGTRLITNIPTSELAGGPDSGAAPRPGPA
jgi:NADH:ubiquinone reductase (H+-translocating)